MTVLAHLLGTLSGFFVIGALMSERRWVKVAWLVLAILALLLAFRSQGTLSEQTYETICQCVPQKCCILNRPHET